MLEVKLENLNFKPKEVKLYLALLELGETNMERLVTKSGLKRATTYDVIESLKKKGFIATTKKNKRTFYYAENPNKIGQLLDEKRNTFNEILPELLSITNLLEKKPSIQYFEGNEGIKKVYEDTLNYPDQEILVWISSEAVDCFNEDYLWEYAEKRKKNKIWQRSIGPNNKITRHLKTTDEKYLRQSRLVSKEEMPFEVEINIYGKRFIGIMSFKEKIGLIIESRKIYNTLKSIFEMNWKMLK